MSNIRKLFCSQLVARLIDKAFLVTVVWSVLNIGTKQQLAWVLVIGLIPHVVLAAFSARIIKNYSPINVLRLTDTFRFFVYLVYLIIIFLLKLHFGWFGYAVLLFVINIAAALGNPAYFTLPTQLALNKDLSKITALFNSALSIANIIGPILAVLLYKLGGIELMCIISALGYAVAAIIDYMANAFKEQHYRQSTHSYLRVIFLNKTPFFIIFVAFMMNLVYLPMQLFMPLYAKEIYAHGIFGLSLMEAFIGIGAVLGAIYLSLVLSKGRWLIRLVVPYGVAAMGYFVFAVAGYLWVGCIGLLILGFSLSIGNITALHFLQIFPDKSNIPAIMTLVNISSQLASPLALMIAGIMLSYVYFIHLALIYSVLMLLFSLLQFCSKNVRNYEADNSLNLRSIQGEKVV